MELKEEGEYHILNNYQIIQIIFKLFYKQTKINYLNTECEV